MPTIGPTELIIILVLVTVLFGAGWLSGTISSVGKGIRSFKAEVRKDDAGAKGQQEPPRTA